MRSPGHRLRWLMLGALASPAHAAPLTFTMPYGAHAFAATLGPTCLTDVASSIVADGQAVTVRDTPACAAEIREIAAAWALYANEPIETVTGTPEALQLVRQRLEQRFGKAPNHSLRFLAETQACRCLAFVGKHHADAAQAAAQLLPRPKPAPERAGSAPLATDGLPRAGGPDALAPKDLIKDAAHGGMAPPST